jgi:ferritin
MAATLSIDYGSKYLGISLVQHESGVENRVLYAATVVAEPKPLKALVETRAMTRRMRRTRKTHERRLRHLADALCGIRHAEKILLFCRRRGFSYTPDETDDVETQFHVPRAVFFESLRREIEFEINACDRDRVWKACQRHLNEGCRREGELRPARFDNRGPSKCQWIGCKRNVPRAANAIEERLQQALFAWLKPIFDVSADPVRLRRSVNHWIGELAALSRAYARLKEDDRDTVASQRKLLDKRKGRIFLLLKNRASTEAPNANGEAFADNWRETYSKNVTEIVKGERSGRVPYCREHSREFVEYFLAGKPIPNRTDITEADLFGRTQQILFMRLWRLVEARLLPLAGGRIDRIIVERAAFDILAGKFKDRRDISEDKAAEMYWHGPLFGFDSRGDMLKQEFDGYCAYCGEKNASLQIEHVLPQSKFPFDSYFNILPSCIACNAQKGARTPLEAGMRVHQAAFDAYAEYLSQLRPPHYFHTIKKGLLKLLTREGHSPDVEKQLGMLAENLLSITNTQKGQRPLARYLAGKLETKTGMRPEIGYTAGRHTAVYRSILLPDYDKREAKAEKDLVNHAVDAVILGCRLPSVAAAENRRWYRSAEELNEWRNKVLNAGPELYEGLPAVQATTPISFFETDLGGGFFQIDLSAFNWNRKRHSEHKLDPVCISRSGRPCKRESAAGVFAELLKDEEQRKKQIEKIAHPALKKLLRENLSHAAEKFVAWLQKSIQVKIALGKMGRHPSDQARKLLLEEFASTPCDQFLNADKKQRKDIPRTIGIRCEIAAAATKFDIARCDSSGNVFQNYMSGPKWRNIYVGYQMQNGQLNRQSPFEFWVNQLGKVTVWKGSASIPLDVMPDSPLLGRPLGGRMNIKEFQQSWAMAFDALCRDLGIKKRFSLGQGVVIEKMDGTVTLLRNFDKGKPWMSVATFRNIKRVYRSPLGYLRKKAGE